ncbi:extracellular solute-binding protein [Paenibacillus sacheonensis]|uniref:Extracellular solute-binding protein n=1 Tax=Paenibacillus sacheonensis TaxID=742054 RepID=A0A7X4YX30_9BACL|nr:extracellular solute-binding protein [Paenibacillus sacheonensis]MBM7569178.1 putative aldouronate transport system substrate-binding protein [Paenibacillus sacheonensis]NBC73004.1 extracellular solute-binding protein [Paenibacillus sacheonensis]
MNKTIHPDSVPSKANAKAKAKAKTNPATNIRSKAKTRAKAASLLLGTAALLAALSACASNNNEPAGDSAGKDAGKDAAPAGSTQEAAAPAGSAQEVAAAGFPIVGTPVTLTALGAKAASHGEWKDMKVLNEYAKKTNIAIDWQTVPDAGFEEKRNIVLSGGDLPDILYRAKLTPYDEVNYGSQGILIPLNQLIDQYAPNIKAMFEKYPEVKKSITAPDGNIYSLPQVADYLAPRIGNKQFINKKWLEKLKLAIPTTTEEYYRVLKAFKEQDPNGNGKADDIPWSGEKTSFNIWAGLRGSWGLGTTGDKNPNIDLGPDGKIRFYTIDPNYKGLLEYLHKLYQEGLIDNEVFTQETPQFLAKGTEGLVGSLNVSNPNVVGPKLMDDYVAVPALKGPNGDHLYSPVNPTTQAQGTFAITKHDKHPEATIRWVDYFYGEEGVKFFRMGIEGETYETLADGSVQYKEAIAKNPDGLSLDQAIGQYSPWPGGGVPQLIEEKVDRTGNSLPSALAAAKLLEPDIPREILPSFLFSKEDQDRLNALSGDITTYVNESRVKFVTGALPLNRYDSYVSTLKKMGVDELTAIYQQAYDHYKQ